MTAKETLERVRIQDDEVAQLRALRASVYDGLTRTTARISPDGVRGPADPHRLDAAAALAADVDEALRELAAAKRAALALIRRLDDSRQRAVLLAYYVNCRTPDGLRTGWEDVAEALHYSLAQVKRVRDAALAAVEKLSPGG